MQRYIMIVAGGQGKRMLSAQPKQFMELAGKPILMHTFNAFSKIPDLEYILVLPRQAIGQWESLCLSHQFSLKHQIAEGGPSRFHSVKSGLKYVPDGCLLAIHDAVRPFVNTSIIQQGFQLAEKKGNAIPAIPLGESIREICPGYSKALNRDNYRLIQTPQIFRSSQLKESYQQVYSESFTDDASVMEKMGHRIQLFEGNPENIKLTHPYDIIAAEAYLAFKGAEEES